MRAGGEQPRQQELEGRRGAAASAVVVGLVWFPGGGGGSRMGLGEEAPARSA